jgi:hypothetical protein
MVGGVEKKPIKKSVIGPTVAPPRYFQLALLFITGNPGPFQARPLLLQLLQLSLPLSPSIFLVMAFFFNRGRSRQPADVARSTKESLLRVQEAPNTPKVPPLESLVMHTSSLT